MFELEGGDRKRWEHCPLQWHLDHLQPERRTRELDSLCWEPAGFIAQAAPGSYTKLQRCPRFKSARWRSGAEIEYLQSVLPSTMEEAFFDYLRTVDASEVTVSSVPEGSVVFARVPLLQVKGPLLVVQLLETTLLCLVNYASLVATNAARFRMLAGPDKKLMEMGLRRAQGPDGGLSASKYSYVGGFDSTSNVLAGKLFGIPVGGTVAHSYIMSFASLEEVQPRVRGPARWRRDSFRSLARRSEGAEACLVDGGGLTLIVPRRLFQGLLDAYCVMGSGVPNFCAVALALNQLGYRAAGVRVDSGDLGQQSRAIRRVLQTCGAAFQVPWLATIPIAVSSDVSERSLQELMQEGNEIDMVGIGTNLVTCPLQPSLGCVYKLVQVNGRPTLKLTEEEEKMTVPGSKAVYRLRDAAGLAFMDLMALETEPPPQAGREVSVRLLGWHEEARRVTPMAVETLHRTYFKDGQVCQALPSLLEIKSHVRASLSTLSPVHKRLQEPEPYQVAVTEKLHFLLNDLRRSSQ
nr:nicotinate phosphoribosyltransferase [Pelodiscus sinensis]|eukprot:XP_025044735.1 nicotinate phosphoribosyltransferase [Pelodiscus sinensis]